MLGIKLPKGSEFNTSLFEELSQMRTLGMFKENGRETIVVELLKEIKKEEAIDLVFPLIKAPAFGEIEVYYKNVHGENSQSISVMDLALESKEKYTVQKTFGFSEKKYDHVYIEGIDAEKAIAKIHWQKQMEGGENTFLTLPESFVLTQMPQGEEKIFVSEENKPTSKSLWVLKEEYKGNWEEVKSITSSEDFVEILLVGRLLSEEKELPILFSKKDIETVEKIKVPFVEEGKAEGKVFQDNNHNGAQEPEERGLEGIKVYTQFEEDLFWEVFTTNAEGLYFYPLNKNIQKAYIALPSSGFSDTMEKNPFGFYELEDGTLDLIPITLKGSVRVKVEEVFSSQSIVGTQILLLKEEEVIQKQVTDEKGEAFFEDLEEGIYTLKTLLNQEDQKRGFIATLEQEITLAQGEQRIEKIDFTPFTTVVFKINVPEENIKINSEINLYKENNLIQTLSIHEKELLYTIEGLYPGEYTLTVKGFDNTVIEEIEGQPINQKEKLDYFLHVDGKEREVQVSYIPAGKINFENLVPLPSRTPISGKIVGEETYDFIFSDKTQEEIENILPGSYEVKVAIPENVVKEEIEADQWTIDIEKGIVITSITVKSGEVAELPSLFFPTYGKIQGTLWEDKGEKEETTSTPLEKIKIELEIENPKEKGYFKSIAETMSNGLGEFEFAQLLSGKYRILLHVPENSKITVGMNGNINKKVFVGESFQIESGEIKTISSIGIAVPSGAEVVVFEDSNHNGLKGIYEPLIEGALIEIINQEGNLIVSQRTNQEGKAIFAELPLGTYKAKITLPNGYWFDNEGEKNNKIIHSHIKKQDSQEGISNGFEVTQGVALQVGIGTQKIATYSGKLWEDINGNGIAEENEPGMAGAIISLKGNKTADYVLEPDEKGYYTTSLRPDHYTVSIKGPEGYVFTRYSSQGGNDRSYFTNFRENEGQMKVVLTEGEKNISPNIGWVKSSSITVKAFIDKNYNGLMDENEKPIQNVEVLLKRGNQELVEKSLTDEKGEVFFSNLRGEEYMVETKLLEEELLFSLAKNQDGKDIEEKIYNEFTGKGKTATVKVKLNDGEEKNLGVGGIYPSKIGGEIFIDANYNGLFEENEKTLSDISVYLVNEEGELIEQRKTDQSGMFLFENLMPQKYFVQLSIPKEYTVTMANEKEKGNSLTLYQNQTEQGISEEIVLEMGEERKNLFLGMVQSGSIKGNIFKDLNDDGLFNEEEMGYEGMEVKLFAADQSLEKTTLTTSLGNYHFTEILPGDYYVEYHLEGNEVISLAMENSYHKEKTSVKGEPFYMEMAEEKNLPSLGILPLGSIRGFSFYDENGNGIFDEKEKPLQNIDMQWWNTEAPKTISSITIGSDGRFIVEGLRPGKYIFQVQLKDEMVFSRFNEESFIKAEGRNIENVEVNLYAGEEKTNCFIAAVDLGEIQGEIWLDENDNGEYDSKEPFLEGIVVEILDNRSQESFGKTVTDSQGEYRFLSLLPGEYTIKIVVPENYTGGKTSQDHLFMMDGEENLINKNIKVLSATKTEGINGSMIRFATIQGETWYPIDGGKEPLEGVLLELYSVTEDEIVAQSMTSALGKYSFSGLRPGQYQIRAVLPKEYQFLQAR